MQRACDLAMAVKRDDVTHARVPIAELEDVADVAVGPGDPCCRSLFDIAECIQAPGAGLFDQ
jgi:hypothetical protein